MTTHPIRVSAALLLCSVAIACGGSNNASNGPVTGGDEPNTIHVVSNQFEPSTLTVAAGTTVTFKFDNGGHNVVSGQGCTPDGQFCSPNDTNCMSAALSAAGVTYTHTFDAAGTYPYFCAPHCAIGMKGTITVQ